MPASAPAPERPVISAAEVAFLLKWDCVDSFRNNRRKLEKAGFPQKLPGVPGWSRASVLRWIDSNAGRDPVDAPAADNVVRLPGKTTLERRFG